MAEDSLVLGIDAVFAVEQGGEFIIDKAAEAVGLAVLFCVRIRARCRAAAACSRGRVGLSREWCRRCSRCRQSGRRHGFGDGVDEQGLRHIRMAGEKGIPVKNIQHGIAACRTLAECRG